MKKVLMSVLALLVIATSVISAADPNNHYLYKKAWELTRTYSSKTWDIYSTQTFSWESQDSLYFCVEGGQNLRIDVRLDPGGPSKLYNYTTWDSTMVTGIVKAITDSLVNVQWDGPVDSLLNVHTAGRLWIRVSQPLDTINGRAVSTYPITRTTKIWYMIKDR